MANLYTSDTHFGHANIIKYCNRPYASVEEMDEGLIANWNAVVGQNDDVYHLGDFAFKNAEAAAKYARRLNGRIHLIWGNHDSNQTRALNVWASSQPFLEIRDEGQLVVLCHYALRVWNRSHHRSLHLYGHSHGTLPGSSQSLDVGADCWDLRPVRLAEIKRRMKTLPNFNQEDKH